MSKLTKISYLGERLPYNQVDYYWLTSFPRGNCLIIIIQRTVLIGPKFNVARPEMPQRTNYITFHQKPLNDIIALWCVSARACVCVCGRVMVTGLCLKKN